jgi:hypothetical protein
MSARLGLNQLYNFSWKGQNFTQITSKIQKNKIVVSSFSKKYKKHMHGARPLPIYRREIASLQGTQSTTGNPRISVKINSFERPGGYLENTLNSHKNNKIGVEQILDKQLVKPIIELNQKYCELIPQTGSFDKNLNNVRCLTAQRNALLKTRSSGIIKNKYYPTTNQYLYNRKKTFEQNQFNYLKSGDPKALPGSAAAFKNTYISGGGIFDTKDNGKSLKCPVVYKPSNYNYSQNGGVDSSTRTHRIQYDELSKASLTYKGIYGTAMEASFADGIHTPGYSIKEKIGYSLTKVPVLLKDGTVRKCEYVRIRR